MSLDLRRMGFGRRSAAPSATSGAEGRACRWLTTFVLAWLLAGCGGGQSEKDRILQAVHDQAQSLHDHDARTFCFKTYSSSNLPPWLIRQLGLLEQPPGSPAGWDRDYRECARTFGKHGEFETGDHRPVPSVALLRRRLRVSIGPPVTGVDGISRTAKLGLSKRNDYTGAAVRFRGDWKIVFEPT